MTHNEVEDVTPSWSADARFLTFSSDQLGNSEIYLVSADGLLLLPLTVHPATDFGASWAP